MAPTRDQVKAAAKAAAEEMRRPHAERFARKCGPAAVEESAAAGTTNQAADPDDEEIADTQGPAMLPARAGMTKPAPPTDN